MRLRSEIWVKAYVRRCAVAGAAAVVARHGDDDAGAIFIRIERRDRMAAVFAPAPAGHDDADLGRRFVARFPSEFVAADEADAYLASEKRFDPDAWIIDVDDAEGRHLLGDDLMA